MFFTFFLLELKRALRQPMVYIFFFVMALMVFGAVSSDNIIIGGTVGNVYKNSPHVVATYSLILTLLSLLIATAFFNNAALRDHEYQFHEILFSTPLKRSGYYFGRFLGALILSSLPLLGIYLGFMIGGAIAPAAGWLEPEQIGPTPYAAFVSTYFYFVLPNLFFAGSIIYALAIRWKSTIISFTGALGLIMIYMISGTLISDIDNETIGALLDSFGIRTYFIDTKYFTPSEKNNVVPGLTGNMLWNRLIWLGAGIIVLLISFSTFRFKLNQKKGKAKNGEESKSTSLRARPMVQQVFQSSTGRKQWWSFFINALKSMVKSPTFKILFLFSFILYIVDLVQGFEAFGLQSYPVSYKMNDSIEAASQLFVIIIIVFFSGELIWKDRMAQINEVIDATPHNSFHSLVAKVLALVSIVSLIDVFMIILGMGYQALNGYFRIEPDVFFGHFFFDRLPKYFILSMAMIFFQVLINQRYIAYFVSILLIFFMDLLWLMFDVESNLVSLASTPRIMYSDMNGFGDGMTGVFWFNLYWILFSLMLLFLSAYLWPRGQRNAFKERLRFAAQSIGSKRGIGFHLTFVGWLAVGGFTYYNTQVLNSYTTSDEMEAIMANYEKSYKQYAALPLPKFEQLDYTIDIYPEERDVFVTTQAILRNTHEVAIEELHFTIDEDWNQEIIIPGGVLRFEGEDKLYRIYDLAAPLQPDETIEITFNSSYITKGFENDVSKPTIAQNGTFINNRDFLPVLGYFESYELTDKNTRRSFDLPPKPRLPKLERPCGDACDVNYLTDGVADWVEVRTTISTSNEQIAIAPGSLEEQWEENGRNYYRYVVDHPSQDFYSFMSAVYKVARREWEGIDIEVYYDEAHPENVEMMLDAVQRSLAYYTEHFGPYYHQQARIIEFPRYQSFAQAFPGTMPYSESIGFIADLQDENDNNIVDAVVAHEMAHQWWAHQEMSAKMQGGTMLTESFAEYSSLMVMKQQSSPMKMRAFLKYDLDRYLDGRSAERDVERPLYKVENQNHIHYGKGSVILYALQDYIGEDSVNAALRSFLQEWAYQGPPYPTSLDFLDHLEPRVPDSLQYLIDDWFKEITLYDFRLEDANMVKREDGRYEVALEISAQEVKADSMGNETMYTPKHWVDIGLFADRDEENLMLSKRVFFDQDTMRFTLISDSLPAKAAIDPRRILIERVYSDNIKPIQEQ
jgi:hypothetical protein